MVGYTRVIYGHCMQPDREDFKRRTMTLMENAKEIQMSRKETESHESDPTMTNLFAERQSIFQVEEGHQLAPRFDAHGLISCVTTDADTDEVLMLSYMNGDALIKTLRTGEAYYWSRSRQAIWKKGTTSGLVHSVVELRIDDDQDSIWLRVRVAGSGASCHVGYRSCFYRRGPVGTQRAQGNALVFTETEKVFDPGVVYGATPSPTLL